jgi:hypothetical protein
MIHTNFTVEAVFSIRPKSEFIVGDSYSSLDWHSKDQDKPTESEFDEALKTVKAEYEAQEYARNRQAEYPSLLELTVALYDTDDKSAVEAKRASVKAKYPKPS